MNDLMSTRVQAASAPPFQAPNMDMDLPSDLLTLGWRLEVHYLVCEVQVTCSTTSRHQNLAALQTGVGVCCATYFDKKVFCQTPTT